MKHLIVEKNNYNDLFLLELLDNFQKNPDVLYEQIPISYDDVIYSELVDKNDDNYDIKCNICNKTTELRVLKLFNKKKILINYCVKCRKIFIEKKNTKLLKEVEKIKNLAI